MKHDGASFVFLFGAIETVRAPMTIWETAAHGFDFGGGYSKMQIFSGFVLIQIILSFPILGESYLPSEMPFVHFPTAGTTIIAHVFSGLKAK